MFGKKYYKKVSRYLPQRNPSVQSRGNIELEKKYQCYTKFKY